MRARLVKEDIDMYSDLGFSDEESLALRSTKNTFKELEDKVREFMNQDKIFFSDLVTSFEKAMNEFIEIAIIKHLKKTLGLTFNVTYEKPGYEWSKTIEASLPDGRKLKLEKSHSGYSYFVTGLGGESTKAKSLHTLEKAIQKYLKGKNVTL